MSLCSWPFTCVTTCCASGDAPGGGPSALRLDWSVAVADLPAASACFICAGDGVPPTDLPAAVMAAFQVFSAPQRSPAQASASALGGADVVVVVAVAASLPPQPESATAATASAARPVTFLILLLTPRRRPLPRRRCVTRTG